MSHPDDFRTARRRRFANRFAQLLLALTLTAGLTYLASQPQFVWRRDLTANRAHSLSPETLAQLRASVRRAATVAPEATVKPVRIFVTLPREVKGTDEEADLRRRLFRTVHEKLDALLGAFVHEGARSGGAPILAEEADPVRNAKLYTELAAKLPGSFEYGKTALVVLCGDRIKAVPTGELLKVAQGAKGPELQGFQGEAAILSAILEVTDARRPVVYYTDNHGELNPVATGPLRSSARWQAELRSRRFDLRPLSPDRVTEVPADADLLIVAGPRVGFSPRETEKLRRYMSERNGRVLLLLEPGVEHGLDELLLDWGLLAQDMLLVDTDPGVKQPDGDTAIRQLPAELHPVSRVLFDMGLPLYAGWMRPIRPDPARWDDRTLSLHGLVFASEGAWGERDYRRNPPYRPEVEKGDFLPDKGEGAAAGYAAERAVRLKDRARISAGRLVALGAADIAADFRYEKGGNRHFLLSAVNWLLGRDYLVSVPARPLEEFKLNASADDLARVARRYAPVAALAAALGFLVHWWRRRV